MLAFLETIDPSSNPQVLPAYDDKTQVLLFFKYYNPRAKLMAYCGHYYVTLSEKPSAYSISVYNCETVIDREVFIGVT